MNSDKLFNNRIMAKADADVETGIVDNKSKDIGVGELLPEYTNGRIAICSAASRASSDFENTNDHVKRRYVVRHIHLFNETVKRIMGNCGSFGTGYPFYALGKNMTGRLPVIAEQLRYNDELIDEVDRAKYQYPVWPCMHCLMTNGELMPDLKALCKPCPKIVDALKPRKIINRLPDIDMWMVCEDGYTDVVKDHLQRLLKENGFRTSDVDPIRTIGEILQIVDSLKKGKDPEFLLPLDAHIVERSYLANLIENVPSALRESKEEGTVPYLPIHPLSLRKTWQKDDVAYNFIYDYLSAFTGYNFNGNLKELLIETRRKITEEFTTEELYDFMLQAATPANKRRMKEKSLQLVFERRVDSWKKQ